MQKREQWGTRFGFIMAAVGSAIGLGNIWRFPYQAYENGGGAFLIPYFFAMLTAGIPLLIMEFGIGHKIRGAAPSVFARLTKNFNFMERWEWLGWWQVLVAVIISMYYVVVVGWTLAYIFIAFKQGWGNSPDNYFFKNFLHISNSPTSINSIQWPVFIAVLAVWLINWIVLYSGVKKGIEFANKIFMPTLIVLVLFLMATSLTMDGASIGLNWLFKPDFSRLTDYKVWANAYGQIFYSMSIAFAIMITYSSYLPKKSDIVNNGFLTGLLNCGFSLISGILIFSILGHMAHVENVTVDKVVTQGVGLAFVTIPKAISYLPFAPLIGGLFFISLTIAGLSSEISINETIISSFMDKYGLTRKKTATIFCAIGLLASMVFVTDAGLLILDIVDHYINNFGTLFTGLTEIFVLSWIFKLKIVKDHINPISDFTVGKWWQVSIKYLTPLVLGSMAIANFVGDIQNPYSGYPIKAQVLFGWAVVISIIFVAFLLQKTKGHHVHLHGHVDYKFLKPKKYVQKIYIPGKYSPRLFRLKECSPEDYKNYIYEDIIDEG